MKEAVDNAEYDRLYRESLPKRIVIEHRLRQLKERGVVSIYPELEECETETIIAENSESQISEDLKNLSNIENAIGFTALQNLIDRHQEFVEDAISFSEIQPISEEADFVRQNYDRDFINRYLVFTPQN